MRSEKKDPDRRSVKEMGLKSTLFWVSLARFQLYGHSALRLYIFCTLKSEETRP